MDADKTQIDPVFISVHPRLKVELQALCPHKNASIRPALDFDCEFLRAVGDKFAPAYRISWRL
jgi:hypothetical protein